ncbi:MFS transporter [Rhodococcus sp. DMU1]|uniref:MFS transporter n=1 Tax=Rhodococcus sp. DMU1 TaxID=2722825 RepID=UPI00143E149A|nr:MFS transporter [Rhodococcus sp. DMU1]QIX53615.1 aromatic acid/H+ symport family MFS transporter [Rhodococcus sp. DMU1]
MSLPPSKSSERRTAVVTAICFAALVFDGYDMVVYGSVVPSLLEVPQWNLSPQQAGAIGSYALFGMFFGAIAAGTLTDFIGRRRVLIGCITWFSALMIPVALAPTPELLGLFRFLAGLGLGGLVPTTIALVVETAPKERRNLINSIMLAGFPAGGMLAAFATILLLEPIGFRGMFMLGALPLVTLVPLAVWLLPESTDFTAARSARSDRSDSATSESGTVRDLFRGRTSVAATLLAISIASGLCLNYALNTWLPKLMQGAGYELGSALTFLLVLNFGGVLGGLFGSALADLRGGKWVACGMFLIAGLSLFVVSIPKPIVLTYLVIGISGATVLGAGIVVYGYIATHFPTGYRATALGFTSGFGRLGAIAGPLIGGALVAAAAGLTASVAVFAAIATLGALAVVLVPSVRESPTGTSSPAQMDKSLVQP